MAPSILDLLTRPLFVMLVNVTEGLIERACKYTALLSKKSADNWNRGYQQVMSPKEGGQQLAALKKREKTAQEVLKVMIES